MVHRPLERNQVLALVALSVVVLLLAYTGVSWRQHLANPSDTTIPSWSQLYEGVVTIVQVDPRSDDRWLVTDSLATGKRLFLGLGMSWTLGVLLGLYMGSVAWIDALFVAPLSLAAKIVPTAAMAVFFVVVGIDLEMYVTMIVFGVLPALALSVQLAAKDVPKELVEKAYTLGASHQEVIWEVIFPSILPKILDAIRMSIGPAMVYLIAAEMLVGDEGFGYRIRLVQKRLEMQVVYPYLVLLAAFGFSMDGGVRLLKSWLCPWAEEKR